MTEKQLQDAIISELENALPTAPAYGTIGTILHFLAGNLVRV